MENDTILIAVIIALLVVVIFQSAQLVTVNRQVRGMMGQGMGTSYQGYSSYEEMMEAHHGSGSGGSVALPAQQGGC